MASKYLLHAGLLGLIVSIALFPVMNVSSLGQEETIQRGIFILSFALFPSTLVTLCENIFVALRQAKYVPILVLSESVILLMLVSLSIFLGFGVISITVIILMLRLGMAACSLFLLMRFCPPLNWRIDMQFCKDLLTQIPIFLGTVLADSLFWRVDVIILSYFRSTDEVGYYAAAMRLVAFLREVPKSVLLATLPPLSDRYARSELEFRLLFERTAKYLLLFSMPVTVGTIVLAPQIITIIFSDGFLPSATFLSTLILSFLPFVALKMVANALTVTDHQKANLQSFWIGVAMNVLLNIVFIPKYGAIAAAWTTVFTTLVIMTLRIVYLYAYVGAFSLDRRVYNGALATVILWIGLHQIKEYPVLITISLSIPAYLVILVLLRAFSRNELVLVPLVRHWLDRPIIRAFFPEEKSQNE
jgi:O-antigen/teichoic acid export membrane protein